MDSQQQAIRGRKVKGRLYKRDAKGHEHPEASDVRGVYWLQYTLGGERVRLKLVDPVTQEPIKNHGAAKAERDRILAPYQTADEIEKLKAVKTRLTSAEERLQQEERAAAPMVGWDTAWAVYEASQNRPDTGPDTLVNYKRHLTKFSAWLAEEHTEAKTVGDVTPVIGGQYAKSLAGSGLTPNTYNKRLGFLSLFYRIMVEEGHAEANPFAKIRRRKLQTHSRKELSREKIVELLAKADGELGMLLGLGYFTGLRRGDCCTLNWSEVDMATGIIKRVPNKTRGRRDNPEPVKVGMPPELYAALDRTPPESRRGFVLPGMAAVYNSGKRDRISRQITNHFEACGIPTTRPGTGRYRDPTTGAWVDTGKRAITDYGFHSLRYSYISHHAERGTPQAVIQANAGHRNPAMTEHYTRISDSTAREVAAVLSLPAPQSDAGGETGGATPRKPLPDWARELIESLETGNIDSIKAELLR